MLDMGWTEIMLIGVVALIVVGPKDLPRMLRTLGQYTGKIRGMARDFQRSMNDAAREADMAEFKDIKGALDDVRAIQRDAKSGIGKALSGAEEAIDREVGLGDMGGDASPNEMLAPTQPMPKPVSPLPKTAGANAGQGGQGGSDGAASGASPGSTSAATSTPGPTPKTGTDP
ncbi:MAG: Sec-independent protein translocase protein TatB [Pseudomonadota bacterium]